MYNPSIYPSLLVLLNADDATIGISNFQQAGSSNISSISPYSGSKSYLFNSGTYSGGLTLPLSFTISCVLRFSSIPSLCVPFSLINSTDSSKIIELFMNFDGAFCVATGSSPASSSIITTGCKPPINTWYTVAITVSSTGVNFYINGNWNGTYNTTNSLTSGIYGNTVNLVLGALNTSNSNPFSGNIDDFRIYGGVMSLYQINTIYTDMTKITPLYYASFENITDGNTLLNNLPVVSSVGIYNFSTANKITGNNSLLMKLSGSSNSLSGTHIKSSVNFYGFSVSFWIRFETLRVVGTDYSLPFLLADTNNASPNLSLHQSYDGRLHGRLLNGGPNPVLTPTSIPVDINIWYHITIVHDYQHAIFYVNGISIGSIFTGVINWKWMYLGFYDIYSQFNGWFDEFKLYQASLSQHQVTALYTSYSTSTTLTGSSVTLPFPRSLKNTSYTVSGSTQLTTTLDKVYTTTGSTDTELKNIYNAFNPVIVGNRVAFCTEKIIYSYINLFTLFSSEQPIINVINSTDTFASISLASDGTIYAGSTSGMLKNGTKIPDTSLFFLRNNAIAIGNQAGQYGQGFNSIAIGNKAGQTLQPSNTIIINANNTVLNATTLNGCFIAPISSYTNSTSTSFNLLGYGSDNQIVKLDTNFLSIKDGVYIENTGYFISGLRYNLLVGNSRFSPADSVLYNNNGGSLNVIGSDMALRTGSQLFFYRPDELNYWKVGVNSSSQWVVSQSGGFAMYLQSAIAQTAWSTTSDERVKENIVPIGNVSSTLMKLQVKSYNYKLHPNAIKSVGFIAQDIQQIHELVDIMVNESPGKAEDGSNYLGVNQSVLTPYLVKAFQEQQTKITSLEAQLASLKAMVDTLISSPSSSPTGSTGPSGSM